MPHARPPARSLGSGTVEIPSPLWEHVLSDLAFLRRFSAAADPSARTVRGGCLATKVMTGAGGLELTGTVQVGDCRASLPSDPEARDRLVSGLERNRRLPVRVRGAAARPGRGRTGARRRGDRGRANPGTPGPSSFPGNAFAEAPGSGDADGGETHGGDPPFQRSDPRIRTQARCAERRSRRIGPRWTGACTPGWSTIGGAARLEDAYQRFGAAVDLIELQLPGDVDPESSAADPYYARLPLDAYAAQDEAGSSRFPARRFSSIRTGPGERRSKYAR